METDIEILPETNDRTSSFELLCTHQLFEKQVLLCPDDIAVVFEGQALSYRKLNEKANRLAHYLKRLGVGPEVLVGLYVERSFELIVGLLGILKAGGAYVPLDPIYPKDRLAFMLQDAQVSVLLTQENLKINLPEFSGNIVSVDADSEKIFLESTDNIQCEVQGDNLAYVIYTSGSTGRPKGVQLQHEGVVSFLKSMAKAPGFSKHDVLFAVTIITFDIAAMEIFLPLSLGAKIFLASRQTTADGEKLMQALEESGATVLQATPATWQLLLESGWQGRAGLKMLCGGEALTRPMANRLLERGASLWNMYGPTETTIWSAILKVERGDKQVPIGPPIDNTEFYILDQDRQLVPDGKEGELYIGGISLARGYLNRPELNEEKFIQNPFSQTSSRLYRTGDLVRSLPDGNLEFLGRMDHQVKIRGFRIELGEIESLLMEYPDIQEAAVLAHENGSSENKHLVAYLVFRKGKTSPKNQELRSWLSAKLPEYMIPSVFLVLDAFPRLPNGKLDRRSLPPIPLHLGESSVEAVQLNPTEKNMREIWRHVLGHQQFGLDDSFFDLGGNSLLAVRLFGEIKRTFKIQLAPALLLERPTVRKLADLILDGEALAYSANPVVAIQPKGSKPPIFYINGIYGDVISFHQIAAYADKDQPIYGLQIPGYDFRTSYSSIEEIASELVLNLRKAQPKGPYYLVGFSFGAYVAYEVAQKLREQNEWVPLLCLIDTYAPRAFSSLWKNMVFSLKFFVKLSWKSKPRYLRNALIALRRVSMQETRRVLYNLLPTGKLRERLFSEERKRYLMVENYRAHKARFYPGNLTLFRSEERILKSKYRTCVDHVMGWGKLAPEIEVRDIPGLHEDVLKEPHAPSLAKTLFACLSEKFVHV